MIDLKKVREDRGMSQKELADYTEISQQYISFIEKGERGKKLPVPTAKKIAAALGFDWTVFYEDQDKHTH